ncbi:DUF5655 domain-containing protein [Taibaiella koreensis]|uniref:DUF5655 domain-containing protein n=1 Tax=Taibaiella koreensis TaxID=1268548 RepID=UPI000E59C1A6|nr:DUF5655 domain-containing protein [Taibaiella koreensis]
MTSQLLPHRDPEVQAFLAGKPAYSLALLDHFLEAFPGLGPVTLHATKTMIGISNGIHPIAWITQLGKQFLHVVLPFPEPHTDNLCFQKIAQVPGQQQYNHHLRLLHPDDINEEVIRFLRLAYESRG